MLNYAGDNVDDLQLNQQQPAHSSVDVYVDTTYDDSHYATLFAIAHVHIRRRQDPCESLHATHLLFLCRAAKLSTFFGAAHHTCGSSDPYNWHLWRWWDVGRC